MASLISLLGCGKPSIPQTALAGVDADSAKVIWSSGLFAANRIIPKNSSVVVFEAKGAGGIEHRAFLQRPHDPPLYLGPLSKQFPGAPLETILVEAGGDRFVFGWVDDSVQGTPQTVVMIPDEADKAEYMKGAIAGKTDGRMFIFPIPRQATIKWDAIAQIQVQTKESLARGSQSFSASGNEWEQIYTPPVDTSGLWVVVQ